MLGQILQWVYMNIANYGGDPENVTLVGQSGGVRTGNLDGGALPDWSVFTAGQGETRILNDDAK